MSACGAEISSGGAVLYFALNGGPYKVMPDGAPIWSNELALSDGPCGQGWYAYRASSQVGEDGLTLDHLRPPTEEQPTYVKPGG